MVRPPLFMFDYSGQQCCAKDAYSIFYLEMEGSIPRKDLSRTHTKHKL